MECQNKDLENAFLRLEKLEKQIEKLMILQQKLIEQQETVIKSSKKLDNHINFVESVYNICKRPFEYIFSYYELQLPEQQKLIAD